MMSLTHLFHELLNVENDVLVLTVIFQCQIGNTAYFDF